MTENKTDNNVEIKEEKKKGFKLFDGKLFQKIKTIKHIEVIILVIFAAVLLLIMFGFSSNKSSASSVSSTLLFDYQKNLEKQLSQVLSTIEGTGKVEVMITFEAGAEQVLAYSTDKQTNTSSDNGRTTSSVIEKTQIVLVGGKPVVLYEVQPIVKGVLIVAQGASNVKVKVEIMQAVSTILKIDPKYIEIFASGGKNK